MQIFKDDLDPDLEVTLVDDDGPMDLTLADDVTVELRDIDGAVLLSRKVSLNEVTVDAEGVVGMVWVEDDTETIGRYAVRVLIDWPTGLQTVDVDEVVEIVKPDAGPALVTVEELINHCSGITLTGWQRNSARVILRGTERGLERRLGRSLVAKERTETVHSLRPDGWAPLAHSPVIELISIDGEDEEDVIASYRLSRDGMYLGHYDQVEVVYRGGFDLDPDDLADVQLAILEKAAGVMTVRHDDTLSVKELETRDDVEMARKVAATWSKDEVEPFDRLRRRVVA